MDGAGDEYRHDGILREGGVAGLAGSSETVAE
jgi:hypothetical protein